MNRYKVFLVHQNGHRYQGEITELEKPQPRARQVLIRVSYSSVNYKDYLSATGHKGITSHYPHVPGIDASGTVEQTRSPLFREGDEVIVTGYDLGMNTYGGFSQYILVPDHWVVAKPRHLTLKEAMIYGTAGFTAGQCIEQIIYQEEKEAEKPQGPVIVTGATGGVGTIATILLNQLGYQVTALSRKNDLDFIKLIGAKQSISMIEWKAMREEKPMSKSRWRAGVDTVGGEILTDLIKTCHYRATITCCGMVYGNHFSSSIFPFILRGIRLIGIDSASCPLEQKKKLWNRLSEWSSLIPKEIYPAISRTISLNQLEDHLQLIGRGENKGRVVVKL